MTSRGPTLWQRQGLTEKFMALSAAVVLVTIGAFAMLDYLHERALVASVHTLLDTRQPGEGSSLQGHDHEAFLARTEQGMRELFTIHVMHLAVTLGVLLATLNVAFNRIVVRPVRDLVDATDVMARGTWDVRVSPDGRDELARLRIAFNRLGDELTRRVADWRRAERLSAIAGLATWTNRELAGIETELDAIGEAAAHGGQPAESAVRERRLSDVVARLQALLEQLDNEFYAAFQEVRLESVNQR